MSGDRFSLSGLLLVLGGLWLLGNTIVGGLPGKVIALGSKATSSSSTTGSSSGSSSSSSSGSSSIGSGLGAAWPHVLPGVGEAALAAVGGM